MPRSLFTGWLKKGIHKNRVTAETVRTASHKTMQDGDWSLLGQTVSIPIYSCVATPLRAIDSQ